MCTALARFPKDVGSKYKIMKYFPPSKSNPRLLETVRELGTSFGTSFGRLLCLLGFVRELCKYSKLGASWWTLGPCGKPLAGTVTGFGRTACPRSCRGIGGVSPKGHAYQGDTFFDKCEPAPAGPRSTPGLRIRREAKLPPSPKGSQANIIPFSKQSNTESDFCLDRCLQNNRTF